MSFLVAQKLPLSEVKTFPRKSPWGWENECVAAAWQEGLKVKICCVVVTCEVHSGIYAYDTSIALKRWCP